MTVDRQSFILCVSLKDLSVDVEVVHSLVLDGAVSVIGWIYFLAWSISFYPQVRDPDGLYF